MRGYQRVPTHPLSIFPRPVTHLQESRLPLPHNVSWIVFFPFSYQIVQLNSLLTDTPNQLDNHQLASNRMIIPSLFKTTLYTRSLISSPPVSLPQIPTPAELRARTESDPSPSLTSLNQSPPPSYSNSPPPAYKKKSWSFSNSNPASQVKVQGILPGERGIPAMKPSMGYLRDSKGDFGMSSLYRGRRSAVDVRSTT